MGKVAVVNVTQKAEVRILGGGVRRYAEGTRYVCELADADALQAEGAASVEDATPEESTKIAADGHELVSRANFAAERAADKASERSAVVARLGG